MSQENIPSNGYAGEGDIGFQLQPLNPAARKESAYAAELADEPLVMGDHRRTVRRDKRGHVIERINPRVHVMKDRKFIECPKGSGNLFFEGTNTPAGRVVMEMNPVSKKKEKKFYLVDSTIVEELEKAAHVPYREPATASEFEQHMRDATKMVEETQEEAGKRVADAELRAIRAEKELKALQEKIAAQSSAQSSSGQSNDKSGSKK